MPDLEIIQYTAAEMILCNHLTGKQYIYFGCPRVTYEKIKSLLANNRHGEAFKMLKPFSDGDRL